MVTRIDKLTPAQEARFGEWREKWIGIGLQTGDADFETFDGAIRVAYEKAGVPFPEKIIRVQSPIVGALAASISRALLQEYQPVERSEVKFSAVGLAVDSAVGSAVGLAVGLAVRSAVGLAVDSAVGSAVGLAVRSAVGLAELSWHDWFGGQFWVGDWGWYGSPTMASFFFDICGLELSPDIMERAKSYRDLCTSVNYFWPNTHFVMVCDRPQFIARDDQGRLHNDQRKAIEYKTDLEFKETMKRTNTEPGMRWGMLTAISFSHRDKHSHRHWKFICDCGAEVVANLNNVKQRRQVSCGCYLKAVTAERSTKHGMVATRIYGIWKGMRNRCLNPHNKDFALYGGRGITVCKEWSEFAHFLADMGELYESHLTEHGETDTTLDRKNVDGEYSSSNCRWATQKEQAANKRKKGWGLYVLDGVVLDEDIWRRIVSQEMTFDEIVAIQNADERAVALKYNKNAIIASGAELIDEHPTAGELFLIERQPINGILDERQLYFLRMKCPTGRTFVEACDPAKARKNPYALHMQAEAFGVSPEIYSQLRREG